MASRARPLVTASRVKGTVVYNAAGDCIGHVHDLSIDKATGQVLYALVSFGNFLGLGRHRFHTVPWSALHYDSAMEGYIACLDRADMDATPAYSIRDLPAFGGPLRPVQH